MATRVYRQDQRAQSAQETRRKVLEAVYDTMREGGSRAPSVDQIATRAGVSRSNIYLVFGSRKGMLEEFGVHLFDRAGYAKLVDAVSDPDALRHLRRAIEAWIDVFAAERDIFAVMFAPVGTDPGALGASRDRIEALRWNGLMRLTEELRRQGYLRAGLEIADATTTLWMLTSFGAFDALRTGRSMDASSVSRVLLDTAERTLLVT